MANFTRATGFRWMAGIWTAWLVITIVSVLALVAIEPIVLPWIAVIVSGGLMTVAMIATVGLWIAIGLAPPEPGEERPQHDGRTLGELMSRGDVARPGKPPAPRR